MLEVLISVIIDLVNETVKKLSNERRERDQY